MDMFESELFDMLVNVTEINGREHIIVKHSVTDEWDEIKGYQLHAALKVKSN